MGQYFESQIEQIRDTVLLMASLAERQLSLALASLANRDDQIADKAEADDTQVDQLEVEVDEMVMSYMATHAPIATDCRLMVAATKIAKHIERIGDHATSIARRARRLNCEPLIKPLTVLPSMGEIAGGMLRDAITAFISRDVDLAGAVIARDKVVDQYNHRMMADLLPIMSDEPEKVSQCLQLILAAQSVERIADHAKNIAEDVHYLWRAEDIRHSRSRLKIDSVSS